MVSDKSSQNKTEIKEEIKGSVSFNPSKKYRIIDTEELKNIKIPEFDPDIYCLVEPNVEPLVGKINNTMVYLIFINTNYF